MPKASRKVLYYAVARGHTPGIYETWEECETQVHQYNNAKYKKFNTMKEAEEFIKANNPSAVIDTSALQASTSTAATLPRYQSMQAGRSTKGKDREANEADPNTMLQRDGRRVVYCDGACKGNGQRSSVAGVGVYWGPDDQRNIAERCPGEQTNNRAELIGIARVLETAPKDNIPLEIKTDSQYSIKCFKEWLPNWRRRGFRTTKNEPVKNLELIKYIDALLTERTSLGQEVGFTHVFGHTGEVGNENADRLANEGCREPELSDPDWQALEQETLERIRAIEEAEVVPSEVAEEDSSIAEPILPSHAQTIVADGQAEDVPPPARPPRSASRSVEVLPVAEPQSRAYPDTVNPASRSESAPLQWMDTGVQTLPWVHPDGLVPPNPCIPSQSQGPETPQSTSQESPITPQKKTPTPVIPEEELNAYADCLLDEEDLAAALDEDE